MELSFTKWLCFHHAWWVGALPASVVMVAAMTDVGCHCPKIAKSEGLGIKIKKGFRGMFNWMLEDRWLLIVIEVVVVFRAHTGLYNRT